MQYPNCIFNAQFYSWFYGKEIELMVVFLPRFKGAITIKQEGNQYYSSLGAVWCESGKEIYLSKETLWFLEVNKEESRITLFATGATTKIYCTKLNPKLNEFINESLKKARALYKEKLAKELRLYWYDVKSDTLTNCCCEDVEKQLLEQQYVLSDEFIAINFIGREFDRPTRDCLILGKVSKVFGSSGPDLKLLNMIEPVVQLDLGENEEEMRLIAKKVLAMIKESIRVRA